MVRTSLTARKLRGVGKCVDLLDGEHTCLVVRLVAFPCDQGSTKSTHDSGNIRTGGMYACDFLKAAQNGIIVECTTLYNDILSKVFGIGELDNLKKCILDDGVGKSCRNIRNACAFLLRLFYF